ncbi:MAG: hypothetical protein CMJ78_03375 [Planctomycetaceae bacterium]|nr:hypothetical protein [Planctomycetaceae bacterium]
MKITVRIPSVLRSCCGGTTEFSLNATNVNTALERIEQDYPSLYTSICNETGSVRQHINLFVNSGLVCGEDFKRPFQSEDILYIFQAVSGG